MWAFTSLELDSVHLNARKGRFCGFTLTMFHMAIYSYYRISKAAGVVYKHLREIKGKKGKDIPVTGRVGP
jgi:hypothetical protein